MNEQLIPSTCPRCDKPVTRLICGANGYFSEHDKLAVASGEAILGGEWNAGQPTWVCLRCVPEWAEVHCLSWRDYEWAVAKEQAIKAGDFQLAAHFRDRQHNEVRGPLQELVAKLENIQPMDSAETSEVDKWLRLYRSENLTVRERAAQGLLHYHGAAVPLPVLLNIFDELHHHGLGAATERVLLRRRDPELVTEMINRLYSPAQFVQEVACKILGGLSDRSATPHLVAALNDPDMWVRRAAVLGLASLRDPASGPALLQHYEKRAEDINVRLALVYALRALGIAFEIRP